MTESSELIEISYTGLNGDLKNPTLQNELSHPIKTNYGSSTSTSTILTVLGVQKYIKRGTILSSSINLSNSNIGIGYILYSTLCVYVHISMIHLHFLQNHWFSIWSITIWLVTRCYSVCDGSLYKSFDHVYDDGNCSDNANCVVCNCMH